MTLSISPSFRLKPQTGQASPINEVGANEVLSGGTFSLVDRGSGDLAWQFSGTGDTQATIGAAYSMTTTNGGTFAVTLRVVTAPTVDFTKYVGYMGSDLVKGISLSQNGAGNIRSRATDDGSSNMTTSIGAVTLGVDVTYVVRLGTNQDIWVTTAGRSGTTANATSTGSFTTATMTGLLIRAAASDVIQVKDIAFFRGKLTDTECANLADSFRATIDAAVSPSATINVTEANDVSAITAVVAGRAQIAYTEANDTSAITTNVTISGTAGSINVTEANDTSAITATASAPSGGTITTGAFKNNTGSVLANLTALTVTVLNAATLAFVKTFTGETTDASGIMVMNDTLIVAGTTYAVVTTNAAGTLGVEKYTAA